MDPGYCEKIPIEILEKILLAVPTYQLPLYESWVCKKWTNIILQPHFWVHKLKRHGITINDKIWSLLQDFENYKIISCLYYASLYQEHRIHQSPISNLVSSIPKYEDDEYNENEDFWVILDNLDAMLMASGVLVCRSYWFASLALKNEKIKALTLLLKLLEARKVPLSVRDDYAFWNFSPRMNYLQILKGSCIEDNKLLMFRGCSLTLEGLPSTLGFISLSIAVDDQNVAIDPGLSKINQNTEISLHLKAGTNISNLPNISTNYRNILLVSCLELSHILWMTEATKKFLTNERNVLIFFNYRLDLKSSENLLNSIAKDGSVLDLDIFCSFPYLSSDSKSILEDLASTLWPNDDARLLTFDCDDDLIEHLAIYYEICLEDYNHTDFIDYDQYMEYKDRILT